MQLKESDIFVITTSLPRNLTRTQPLPTPLTAKFLHQPPLTTTPSDVFAAKLKVEYLTGTRTGQTTAAWDLVYVFSATHSSPVDGRGWRVFHFEGFKRQKAVLQLDYPREAFQFRFVVETWVMRERVGELAEGSVREKGKIELFGVGVGEGIQVDAYEHELEDDIDLVEGDGIEYGLVQNGRSA